MRRRGHKHYPSYDLVVTTSKKGYQGRALARVGFLNLNAQERFFFIDLQKLAYWLNSGCLLHHSVKKYLATLIRE